MAQMFGVAKQTVQRTIDQLRVEGLLITKPGSGTYVRGTRRRLNRLSRGRYGAHRGYHADLAARYRQQLTEVGRAAAAGRGRRRVRRPRRHRLLVRRHLVRTQDAAGRGGRVLVAAGGRRPAPRWSGLEAFGRPLYQEVEEVTGRRYVTADRHDQRPAAQPGGGRDPADPAGHAGAAPAARRVRRRRTSRSRWRRRPGRAR